MIQGEGAVWALGMMSGTSLDGVDAALIKGDGRAIAQFGPTAFRAYAPRERAVLQAALDAAAEAPTPKGPEDPRFQAARQIVTEAHVQVAESLIANVAPEQIPALIGFHGQTVLHRPQKRLTVQIGDAEALAQRLGRPVIHDFRSADVAAGGQGAPFAPFYHAALAHRARRSGTAPAGPIAFLNLGGVGNVSWIAPTLAEGVADPADLDMLLAFDTGPANAPVDDWMRARAGRPFDEQGAAALAGRVDEERVATWVFASSYLSSPPPKSLDRLDFHDALEELLADPSISLEDGAATLTAFAAQAVAAGWPHLPEPPVLVALCGGGRRNPALRQALERRLPAKVAAAEDLGFDGDMIEAQAFAHLAIRSARGMPLSAPGSTGAPAPITGGRLVEP